MSLTPTMKTFACALLLHPSLLGMASALTPTRDLQEESEGDSLPLWTYRRTTNNGEEPFSPSEWFIGFPDCGGDYQSPINLSTDIQTQTSAFDLQFVGTECPADQLRFEADDATWEVDFTGCDGVPHLLFDSVAYNLENVHIHSPSEHMIGGSSRDAEIHLVHSLRDTTSTGPGILVVAVRLDVSEFGTNEELDPLWDVLDSGASSTGKVDPVKPYNLLPANPAYSHYVGSLTTPPCTEGIFWIVMDSPATISKAQLELFRTSVGTAEDSKVGEFTNTNRPAQDINGRTVYFVT